MSERRHELGLTQRDVVERLSSLGLSTTNRTLSAMEHGQGVDIGRLPELALALDCTVTYLLGMTSDPCCWVPDEAARAPGSALEPAAASSPARIPSPAAVSCAICADHPSDAPAGAGRPGA